MASTLPGSATYCPHGACGPGWAQRQLLLPCGTCLSCVCRRAASASPLHRAAHAALLTVGPRPHACRRALNPDASSCLWINNLLAQAWPHLERFGCRFLKSGDFLEGQINATTFWRPPMLRSSYIKVQGVALGQVGACCWWGWGVGGGPGCLSGWGRCCWLHGREPVECSTGPAGSAGLAAMGASLATGQEPTAEPLCAPPAGTLHQLPLSSMCMLQEPPRVTGIKAFPKQGGLHDEVRGGGAQARRSTPWPASLRGL